MKNFRLISSIVLTVLTIAGCEWDSSKYDNYVLKDSVTLCPGTFISETKFSGISACNMVSIGNVYCGPESKDKSNVDLIVFNDDGSIYCVSNLKSNSYDTCNDGEDFAIAQRYPEEWKTCQDYRANGLFEGMTTVCAKDEDDVAKAKIEALQEKLKPLNLFIEDMGVDNSISEKYDIARTHGICPSDYPVCHYDSMRKQIGCIQLIACGDQVCDPRTQVCDESVHECVEDRCQGLCNSETQSCRIMPDGSYGCVNLTEEYCGYQCDLTSQFCKKMTSDGTWACAAIDSDPCNGACDQETEFCKKNADKTYSCASYITDPCRDLNCSTSEYCAKESGKWACVDIKSCPNECETAVYGCLTDDLQLIDSSNCGGCSKFNSQFNCKNLFKNANVSCDQGQCVFEQCIDGFYQNGDKTECLPYGTDDAHCKEGLDCTNVSTLVGADHWLEARCVLNVDYTKNKCEATRCAAGYHLYQGGCEVNDNENCGEHNHSCTTDIVEGSGSVTCESGRCIAETCDDAHLYVSGVCVPDSGVCTRDKCQNDLSGHGVLVPCNSNHYDALNMQFCQNSCNGSGTACGQCLNDSRQCANTIPQQCMNGAWINAKQCADIQNGRTLCTEEGECQVTCNLGARYDEAVHDCLLNNTAEHCGNSNDNCIELLTKLPLNAEAACIKGQCDIACKEGWCMRMLECVSVQSDTNNCGTCGHVCMISHATGVQCQEGTCVATGCEPGYTPNAQGQCELSCTLNEMYCVDTGTAGSLYTCTSEGLEFQNTCDHAYSCENETECGECVNDSKRCSVINPYLPEICQEGSWQKAVCTIPDHAQTTCVNEGECHFLCDDGYVSNGKICCAKIANGTILNTNTDDCQFKCNAGFHQSDDNKVCIKNNTVDHCGKEDLNCEGTNPAYSTPVCVNGSCSFTCENDYCRSGNACVSKLTNLNNCGFCGAVCNTSSVPNSASVMCQNGVCMATACQANYRLVNSNCVYIPECNDDERRCVNDGTHGVIYMCRDKEWISVDKCDNGYSCNRKGTDCGVCTNGTYLCSTNANGLTASLCTQGQYSSSTVCIANEDAQPTCDSVNGCGTLKCEKGQTLCSSICVNLLNNVNHCGACNFRCSGGACVNGHCVKG